MDSIKKDIDRFQKDLTYMCRDLKEIKGKLGDILDKNEKDKNKKLKFEYENNDMADLAMRHINRTNELLTKEIGPAKERAAKLAKKCPNDEMNTLVKTLSNQDREAGKLKGDLMVFQTELAEKLGKDWVVIRGKNYPVE